MTSQSDFLRKLVDTLNAAEIPYMLAGSMCSSFHGQPRATNDVDIVIAPTEAQIEHFIQLLGKDYYVSSEGARAAFRRKSAFNVIDISGGLKADFIICRDRPFSVEEFKRRQSVSVMGMEDCIVSPEDAIISKLEWAKDSASEQQFRDALSVAVTQYDRLDKDYLHRWAKKLQVESALKRLLKQARTAAEFRKE